MLEDSSSCLVVTDQKQHHLAEGVAGSQIKTILIDTLDFTRAYGNPEQNLTPDHLANIFYTSGSTGKPKGVVQNHRNVIHNIEDVSASYRLKPSDRLALLISTSFAASQTPVFGALLNGAGLFPFSLQAGRLLGLASWLKRERITLYLSVPSTFRGLCQTLSEEQELPDLRLVVLGGEAVTKGDVELYQRHFSNRCRLCVRLASTETFRIRSFVIDKQTEIDSETVPVGFSVTDKEVVLLSNRGHPVALGETGEIVVKSPYLSPGYWNDPELTKSAFASDPENPRNRIFHTGNLGRLRADGCLEFLGRKDLQTKIRGYRVELGETEQALLSLEDIEAAAVVALEDKMGEKYLAAYVVYSHERRPAVENTRRELERKLPPYMIPSHFIHLERLPLTATGKIDRQQLPSPDFKRPDMETPYAAPRNDLEIRLTHICEELLGIHPIGIRDRFIELGADSLNYVLLAVEIEKRFGRPFPLSQFLAKPTVEQLADLLGEDEESDRYEPPTHPWTKTTYKRLDDNSCSWKLLKMVVFSAMRLTGWLLPYGWMSTILCWLCHQSWVQTTIFKNRLRLFQQILPYLDYPEDRHLKGRFLFNRVFRDVRLALLARLPRSRFTRYTRVVGLERVNTLVRKGSGVLLLNSHAGPPHFDLLVLDREGIDNILTLGGWPSEIQLLGIEHWHQLKMAKMRVSKSERFLFSLLSLQKAETCLRSGGIVRIAPDSIHGNSGTSLLFCGRVRPFRAGFAELALTTGAAVTPVFMRMERNGQVTVEFLEPLDTGDTETEESVRIDSLISQYSDLLERHWRKDPANLSQLSIQRFLELPFPGDQDGDPQASGE